MSRIQLGQSIRDEGFSAPTVTRTEKVKQFARSAGSKILSIDQFSETFTMGLESGRGSIRTCMGTFFTLIVSTLVVSYALQKTDILINKKDFDIFSTVVEHSFDSDFVFSHKEHRFNIAAAFTAYDSETEPILDPRVGTLEFKAYEWGIVEGTTDEYFVSRKTIPSHICTREELGLDGSNGSTFLPINDESTLSYINLY